MAGTILRCQFCGQANFASKRGLNQHQQNNKSCYALLKASLFIPTKKTPTAYHYIAISTVIQGNSRDLLSPDFTFAEASNTQKEGQEDTPLADNRRKRLFAQMSPHLEIETDSANNGRPIHWQNEEESEDESVDLDTKLPALDNIAPDADNSLRDTFNTYIDSDKHSCDLTESMVDAIKLMALLRKTNAPLQTYENVMKWHFECKKELQPHENVTNCPSYIS